LRSPDVPGIWSANGRVGTVRIVMGNVVWAENRNLFDP
jgi:hypothetical protein